MCIRDRHYCKDCAKKSRGPGNYIIMNPVCSATQQLESLSRHRSDSLDSAKRITDSITRREETDQDWSKSSRGNTLSSGKSMVDCTGNRDSSSSNDSGFSFGSLKGVNSEIQYQPLINRKGGSRSNSLKLSELGASGMDVELPTCHQRSRRGKRK